MKRTHLKFAALAMLLTACAAPARLAESRDGTAALGQTTYVDGPKVMPLELLEDSRCPANARCVWAGQVRVRAKVISGAWQKEMELTLGKPVQVADGELQLVAVEPMKIVPDTAKPEDYRFSFRFAGGL